MSKATARCVENECQNQIRNSLVCVLPKRRLSGDVVDASRHDVGVLFPRGCGLQQDQFVRVVYQDLPRLAQVTRIDSDEQVDYVGLEWI